MIKCMNSDCINYKLALEDNIEECPACGKATTKTGKNVNNSLALGAMGIGAVSVVVYWFWGFGFGDFGVGMVVSFAMALGGIIMGFISKSTIAIVLTLAFMAFMVGNIIFWML